MRVVVLGAGYAGVTLARRLESSLPEHAELVVVDDTGHHLVQHELHRLVRNPGLVDDVRLPLAEVLDRATVRTARVAAVDTDARTVALADGEELSYDVAAVCLGAETEFYGLDGVEDHAVPLKRVDHAARLREAALDAGADGRVVVGGAGLSGVQVAGELAAMTDEDGAPGEVVLVEQADAVAPGFDGPFQRALRDALAEAGVDVRTGATVEGADADAVRLADGALAYDAFAWTGGIRGSAAMGGERPQVRATLAYDDGTFVVGDAARVVDGDGEAVPATAQSATRAAKVAATNVERLVADGEDVFEPRLERFTFEPAGWAVSVGDAVVATVGGQVLTGGPARAAKAAIGARHLAGIGDVERALDVVSEELGVSG